MYSVFLSCKPLCVFKVLTYIACKVCLCPVQPCLLPYKTCSWLMLLCDLQCGKSWFIRATFNHPQLKILWHVWPYPPRTHTHKPSVPWMPVHLCHCALQWSEFKDRLHAFKTTWISLIFSECFYWSLEFQTMPSSLALTWFCCDIIQR